MCGIAGFVSRGDVNDERVLHSMLEAIHHRGPDDLGTFADGRLSMGMTRLAIIDVQGGKQPMSNETGTVNVVFNGEIYNYRELAAALRRNGHVLRTDSDTEVIAHLYEEHGSSCVDHLRGMFTFALWDREARTLLLARDRFGIKPLYYSDNPDAFVFGSEIKALVRHPSVRAELDPEALGLYLSLKYVPAPHTMFAGVRSLLPGHVLELSPRGTTVRQYWDLDFGDSATAPVSPADSVERSGQKLLELLQESVDLHLRADVPFGAFLSGGVDSSLVVALMTRSLKEPVRTFALGFDGAGGKGDELPHARAVANHLGTEHAEVRLTPTDFLEDAERVIWHLDQPIADQATVATYRLARAASQEVKMVLTGEGGDELFAGYARYRGERLAPLLKPVPHALRRTLWAAADRVPGDRTRRAKIAIYALLQDEEATRFANWFPLFNDGAVGEILSPSLRDVVAPDGAAKLFAAYLARVRTTDPVQRMLYVDSKLWLPDYLLLRGDKLTMAHSLEARVPLLDHVLAEFAASRPSSEKVKGSSGKHLLKHVARQLLPSEIIDRPKEGFPVPLAHWFRADARSFVNDLLAASRVRNRGLFDPAQVERLLSEHDRGRADNSQLIWGLASVELWHQAFTDTHSRPAPNLTRRVSVGT